MAIDPFPDLSDGCPSCGGSEFTTAEELTGTSGFDVVDGEIEWDGFTSINYESAETVGITCIGCDEGWGTTEG